MKKAKKFTYGTIAIALVSGLFISSVNAKVLYGVSVGGNRDYIGGDYANFKVKDLDECVKKCSEDTRCKVFAYADPTKTCALKEKIGEEVRSPGMQSGHKL